MVIKLQLNVTLCGSIFLFQISAFIWTVSIFFVLHFPRPMGRNEHSRKINSPRERVPTLDSHNDDISSSPLSRVFPPTQPSLIISRHYSPPTHQSLYRPGTCFSRSEATRETTARESNRLYYNLYHIIVVVIAVRILRQRACEQVWTNVPKCIFSPQLICSYLPMVNTAVVLNKSPLSPLPSPHSPVSDNHRW